MAKANCIWAGAVGMPAMVIAISAGFVGELGLDPLRDIADPHGNFGGYKLGMLKLHGRPKQ